MFRPFASRSRSIAGLAFFLLTLCGFPPVAFAQYARLDPDFRSMQGVGGDTKFLLRDSLGGWTYFFAHDASEPKVGGVSVGRHFRVSDSGIVDPNYRPYLPNVNRMLIGNAGELIVDGSLSYADGSTRTGLWRVVRRADGSYAVEAIDANDAPVEREAYASADNQRKAALRLPGGGNISVRRAEADNGAFTELARIGTDGNVLWRHVIEGVANAIAFDPDGRFYVTGASLGLGDQRSAVLRFLADGRLDAEWWFSRTIAFPSGPKRLRAFSDRLVVVFDDPSVASYELGHGGKLSERSISDYASGTEISRDGRLPALNKDGELHQLDTFASDARNDLVADIAYSTTGPAVLASVAWGDGYVLAGSFDYWLDGKRFRNIIRLDSSFKPDTSWNPGIRGVVRALAVDREGKLVVGGLFVNGEQANLMRFSTDGLADRAWNPKVVGAVHALRLDLAKRLLVGGNFREVSGLKRSSLARFNLDGTLDAQWAPELTYYSWGTPALRTPVPFSDEGVNSIIDLGPSGVFAEWSIFNISSISTETYSAIVSGQGTGVISPSVPIWRPSTTVVDEPTGDIFTLLPSARNNPWMRLAKLRASDLSVDSQWGRDLPLINAASNAGYRYSTVLDVRDGYVYACIDQLRRYSVVDGKLDTTWPTGRDWYALPTYVDGLFTDYSIPCTPYALPKLSEVRGQFLAWSQNALPRGFVTPFDPRTGAMAPVLFSRTPLTPRWPVVEDPVRVVEYYARDARRFFITSRANEIEALDALPQSFARTGMQFDAAKPVFLNYPKMAVCRFYAPPSAGGSNTHFYGVFDYAFDECVALKQIPALRYEGFDFAIARPLNGACAATTPVAVYRLFNQQVATNNGNHRYVVSAARRAEMVAAGWVDEGIVFCAANASDSGALTGIVR